MTLGRMEWLDRLVNDRRHCWKRSVAKQCLTCQLVNFNARLEISACQSMQKCFPARLSPKGRSERDAPVGVLVGWNGGCQKKLSAAGCSNGGCGFREVS